MNEPLSPDRVFDFPEDELEPHLAYDFFSPTPLTGYASNPNNNNGWLAVDDYLLGELEAMVGEHIFVPSIEEVVEPVAEAEVEQTIASMADMEEGQMDVPKIDMEEDLAVLTIFPSPSPRTFCTSICDRGFEYLSGQPKVRAWAVNAED
nr:hypothetical protein [Tanacetum cinerariifolium]